MRDANTLVAGIDYPRTLQEFDTFFPNEDACRKYLAQLRWPQGCQCPACDSLKAPWPNVGIFINKLFSLAVEILPMYQCPVSIG